MLRVSARLVSFRPEPLSEKLRFVCVIRRVERDRKPSRRGLRRALRRMSSKHRQRQITEAFVAAILGQFALAASIGAARKRARGAPFSASSAAASREIDAQDVSVWPSHARTRKRANGRWRISPRRSPFQPGIRKGFANPGLTNKPHISNGLERSEKRGRLDSGPLVVRVECRP